ncbi:MAG: class I SAM-dependent methyltransferase [Verrucomicrobiota bacterium]|nr:class I SAM-dependent methyltransferase [Verrucomicrobiota bacterium]
MNNDKVIIENVGETTLPYKVDTYFASNEKYMLDQWNWYIWPLIKDCNFHAVMEVACGHGRNSNLLIQKTDTLYLVDANSTCIDACKLRFSGIAYKDKKIVYVVNNGYDFSDIPSNSVSFIYSWDSFVHFDQKVIESYVNDMARVLQSGGMGFIHHSNLAQGSTDWKANPGWRSKMSAELFAAFCKNAGLSITQQNLFTWDYVENLDCLSLFTKA